MAEGGGGGGGGAGGGGGGARSAGASGDAETLATANLDLSATHARMKKVLGKNWTVVLADLKKKGAARNGEEFRDAMAKSGVPLTGKEVRALELKFSAGAGAGIDVDKLMSSTFKSPVKA